MAAIKLPSFGVRLPNSGPFASATAILDCAIHAEHLGYDRIWVHDHISWPRDKLTHFATGSLEACADQDPNFFESITTAAFLLGRLQRIGVGIAGLVLPLRDPRILGKQLATADLLGTSRLTVACAIGAIPGDFDVMGIPYHERGKRANHALGALRTIFGPEQPADYQSGTVAFQGGTFLPRPRGLQVWVTGSSEPGLRRAARYGDGWMTVYQSPSAYQAFVAQLDALVQEAGRKASQMAKGYETYACVAEKHDDAIAIARRSLEAKFGAFDRGLEVCLVGDTDEFLARSAEYAAAGAGHLELKFIAHDVPRIKEMMARVAAAAGLPANTEAG